LTSSSPTGDRFALDRVWEAKDHAGFRFADWIGRPAVHRRASPYPKRSLRLRLDFQAEITH
jgi:hypothetical protein